MRALLLVSRRVDGSADCLEELRDRDARSRLAVHSADARHCRHAGCDRGHYNRHDLVVGCDLIGIHDLDVGQSAFLSSIGLQKVEVPGGQSAVEVVGRRAVAVVAAFDTQPASARRAAQTDLATLRNHHPRRRYQYQGHFVDVENLVRPVVAVRRLLVENSAQHVGASFPP